MKKEGEMGEKKFAARSSSHFLREKPAMKALTDKGIWLRWECIQGGRKKKPCRATRGAFFRDSVQRITTFCKHCGERRSERSSETEQ